MDDGLPQRDPRDVFDEMLVSSPIVETGVGEWTIVGHRAICAAASDPARFSSATSRFLQIPNALDGVEHVRWRSLLDPFLSGDRVRAAEPACAAIADRVVRALPRDVAIDAVGDLGATFAVRAQIGWLGWDSSTEPALLGWMRDHRVAVSDADDEQLTRVAQRFDDIVRREVRRRREANDVDGQEHVEEVALADVTSELCDEQIDGRLLTEAEIISILRNWTAGDLGSIAVCIGVVVHALAVDDHLQQILRRACRDHDAAAIDLAIDELLRIDDPFLANRRVTSETVSLAGVTIPAGARVTLAWTAANRDPELFGDPDAYRPRDNAPHNLVYGVGPHACPGRLLASMRLRAVVAALLGATERIELAPGHTATRSHSVTGGWASLPVLLA